MKWTENNNVPIDQYDYANLAQIYVSLYEEVANENSWSISQYQAVANPKLRSISVWITGLLSELNTLGRHASIRFQTK